MHLLRKNYVFEGPSLRSAQVVGAMQRVLVGEDLVASVARLNTAAASCGFYDSLHY